MLAIVSCLDLGFSQPPLPIASTAKARKILKRHLQKKTYFFFYPVVDLIALNCSIFMRNHDVLFGKTNPCLRCIERCWVDDFQAVLCFAKRFCMLVTVK